MVVEARTRQPATEGVVRERSTIGFPYGDLDSAVRVAKGVHEVGGTGCQIEQLAANLNVKSDAGGFRGLILTAKNFTLITYRKGSVQLTPLGQSISDPQQEKTARVQAFLSVQLYQEIYNKYKGGALPPPSALENEMVELGVAKKSRSKARQPFQRSATQAGFFAYGPDRLVEPNLGNGKASTSDGNQGRDDVADRQREQHDDDGGNGGRHDLITGLIKKLPPESTAWATKDRYKWLQAANTIFDLIYESAEDGGSLKIEIQDAAK